MLRTDHRQSWQRDLSDAVRDPNELVALLRLPETLLPAARRAARLFPLLAPRSYLARIRPGEPHDPLLRQILPIDDEFETVEGFLSDPVDDAAAKVAPGLLHKYTGRALLVTTGACAVHCRYCFRRDYPYDEEPGSFDDWEPAFEVLRSDESIHEVLLSGGDPWTLPDRRLFGFLDHLEAIPHLRRVRFHTRLPIVLPSRVTDSLIARLLESRLTPWVVVHANHPQEITGDCAEALRHLVRSGISVLNQAVLLRGVNNDVDVLAELCERLIDLGVKPYYLHQLDRVMGAAHFEVDEAVGHDLIAELRRRLPGYAVPEYVREVAGAAHKVPLEQPATNLL